MFMKWNQRNVKNTSFILSPASSSSLSSSSSSSLTSSSSSSLVSLPPSPDTVTPHQERYMTRLKRWLTPTFMIKHQPRTPSTRHQFPFISSQQHQKQEQQNQQQNQHLRKQKQRWSVDMVHEYLSSPVPRRSPMKYPPPTTCGSTFLSTIPEI